MIYQFDRPVKIENIPEYESLLKIFDEDWCRDCNWASESSSFSKFVHLLDMPAYRERILLGLLYSLGGVSANLVRDEIN